MTTLATNNPIYTQITTFAGLQQIADIVNSATTKEIAAKKEAAAAKTREKQRVTTQDIPGKQRVGPHSIKDDTPDVMEQVRKRVEESAKNASRPKNVVRNTTFNKPIGKTSHQYPTRNLIQPVQVLGLGLPPQRPETDLGIGAEDGDMLPFLVNAIIDDDEGEVDLGALIHGIQTLEHEINEINAVICPKTGKQLEFRHLIADPITSQVWDPALSVEVNRLLNTKTIKFLRKAMIPRGEKAVYTRLVVDLRPNKEVHERLRMCMGGDQMESVMDTIRVE